MYSKRRVIIALAALLMASAGHAALARAPTPLGALERLCMAEAISADWFDPAFLNLVPLEQIERVFAELTSTLGACQRVETSGDDYLLVFGDGGVLARVALEDDGRISNLELRLCPTCVSLWMDRPREGEPPQGTPPRHRAPARPPSLRTITTEVLVVGGSPAGVAAALAAAREGRRVILLEPRPFLGTVLTGAMLNVFDLNHRHGLSVVRGIYEQISTELGLAFDPRRAREIFLRKIRTQPRIRLMMRTRPVRVILENGKLLGMLAEDADARTFAIRAQVTVDATEDGDVAAAAGARYTMGREETGVDRRMQPATLLFRIRDVSWPQVVALIQNERGRYRSGIYLGYLWGFNSRLKYYRPQDPRLEFDTMNVGRLPDGSAWINGLRIFGVDGTRQPSRREAQSLAEREIPRIVQFLRRSVPGFANASLLETAPELYVRETRHIWGLYRLTARDVLDGRIFWDRITVASYPIDIHPYIPGWINPYHPRHTLYTIPLRALIPERPDGLLVASRAFSATSQAAGSARVVPVTMALGESAGAAAALAAERRIGLHQLARSRLYVAELQARLRARGVSLDP